MIPAWAAINFDFDQNRIKNELLANDIFAKSMVATTTYTPQKKSMWDPEGHLFSEEIFSKQSLIPHYQTAEQSQTRNLVQGQYNTFQMLNLTYFPESVNSRRDGWEGSMATNDRTPLWIKYLSPWQWRDDLDIPFTKSVIQNLPMEYLLTTRCIIQQAPSIGVVHKDSGVKMNQQFYSQGFGSITLNICSGGANLWFVNNSDGKKYQVNESQHKCWHFDDSNIHCTSEVADIRIQLRIFGKLSKPYSECFNSHQVIV